MKPTRSPAAEATLNSIKQRGGYTQALTYSSGQISFVSDSYGRQLGFSYSSAGLLTAVTTPDSLTLTYGYVAFTSAGAHLLSTVTYNTSPATHQTYLYENTTYPYALTGITDENGNRYATWGYDGNGRGILSRALRRGELHDRLLQRHERQPRRQRPAWHCRNLQISRPAGRPEGHRVDRAANGTRGVRDRNFHATIPTATAAARPTGTATTPAGRTTATASRRQIAFASTTTEHADQPISPMICHGRICRTRFQRPALNANFTYDSSGNNLTDKLTDTTSTSLPYSTNGQTRTWTYTYNRTGEVLTAQLPRTDVTAKTTYAYDGRHTAAPCYNHRRA